MSGNRNLVGASVTEVRKKLDMKQTALLAKQQLACVDLSIPALSLQEDQKRPVSDLERKALSEILGVTADWLLGEE